VPRHPHEQATSIDPLLRPTHERQSGTDRAPEPRPALPRPSNGRLLRIIGATGMGSLLAVTGYVTAGAGQPPSGGPTAPSTVGTQPPTTIVAATVPITVATTTVPTCDTHYSVQPGDSWYRIAGLAGVAVDDLYAANNASAATMLFPDQDVCLPAGTAAITVPPTTAPPATTAAPTPAAPAPTPQSSSHSS